MVLMAADGFAAEAPKAPAYAITDWVRATEVPVVRLPARAVLSPEEVARIKQLIANLALIESPDMGLSSTYGGSAFAPIPQTTRAGVMILGAERPKTSADLVELVKLGPKAMPYLLAALDDPTPAKLVIGHPLGSDERIGFGGVFRGNEIAGNPANRAEQVVIGEKPEGWWTPLSKRTEVKDQRHIVTVGDVCFVIIGQITGRSSYRVARYQPSAITIINSPTDDPALVKQVRAIWSAEDAAQHLLDALLLDFSTTLNVPKDAPRTLRDQAYGAWFYPFGAAMRLLYYFPEETEHLVAQRLVRSADDDAFRRDGFRHMLEAVMWSERSAVREKVLAVFRETTEPALLLLCLPAVEQKDNALVARRIRALLDALPPATGDDWGNGPYDDAYGLVRAAGERLGAAAKPIYLRFAEQSSFRRRVALCAAIRVRPEWAVEFMAPLLDDKREERMWYPVVAGDHENRLAIRVCDDAAQAISLSRPDLPFVLQGTHADLDRQIAVMKELIGKASAKAAANKAGGKQ